MLEVRQSDRVQCRFEPAAHLVPRHAELLHAEGHLVHDVGGKELRLEILGDQPDHAGEVGDSFVHAADVFHHPLHVEHPEWDTQFDADPVVGLATRLALFAELADSGATVLVSHIAGLGRIERVGDTFRWIALSD